MTSKALFSHSDMQTDTLGVLVLLVNLLNGVVSGLCVVLLRKTMTCSICESSMEVTAYKTLTAALLLFPFSIWIEPSAILSINGPQAIWILLSSLTILVYHLSLSLLCSLTSSVTVGMIESLRPVPACGILLLMQGLSTTQTDWTFWVGSFVILMSTLLSEVSNQILRCKNHNDTMESTVNLPCKKALIEWNRRRPSTLNSRSSRTDATETSMLLDSDCDEDRDELLLPYRDKEKAESH